VDLATARIHQLGYPLPALSELLQRATASLPEDAAVTVQPQPLPLPLEEPHAQLSLKAG
jgi:hypothetical protein